MNRVVRRKLAMAKRVRDFCRAHPADVPGFLEVMEELEWRLDRVAELVDQRRAAQREDGSQELKEEIRATIRDKYLRNLIRIARAADDIDLLVARLFRLPNKKAGGATFLTWAVSLLGEAAQRQELFIRDGMPATFVADARALLDQYSRLLEAEERANHDLKTLHEINQLTAGTVRLVKRLDGINFLRFQEDPGMLEAWQEVRSTAHEPDDAADPGEGMNPAA
jgi:hypothetical protein